MTTPHTPDTSLDLRQTKCPLNFVQAKLALEKLPPHSILEILLAVNSDSSINIPNSLIQEGHTIVKNTDLDTTTQQLWIQKGPATP